MLTSRVVVVGASKGGVEALTELVKRLPVDFPAAICVVQHIGPHRSVLPKILSSKGTLPASHPKDGEPLQTGHIYVAPPDLHMTIEGNVLRLTRTAKESQLCKTLPMPRSQACP